MPKTINFNSINRPYLRLIMQDDAQTTIDVTTPTEAMVEELTATAPELEDVLKTMDANSIRGGIRSGGATDLLQSDGAAGDGG